MLKSSRLVAITGCMLGLAVSLLPLGTHATTSNQQEVTIRAIIDGYLALEATGHTNGTGTYDSTNNSYTGNLQAGTGSTNFGTTAYQVTCNYMTYTPEGESTSVRGCENGWNVSATVTNSTSKNYDDATYEGIMIPSNPQNAYTIKSNKAAGLGGATSNWLMKVTGSTTTVDGHSSTVTPYTSGTGSSAINYGDFEALPLSTASSKTVVTGNTFYHDTTGSNDIYYYLGNQTFSVTYGVSAGAAPADTYSGTITYTLSVNAS